jgi:serine/threonine protein kinase
MPARDPFGWVGHTLDGRYDITSVAGMGGFGVVYRGHHRALDAPVAIKCLRVPQDRGEDERRAFERRFTEEGRVLHRLSRASASIVQALDVGSATAPSGDWTPYLVLEWLEGATLDAIVTRRRRDGLPPLSSEEALRWLAPAAEALAEAHDQRIAHRDVKPANLFLAHVGGREVMKVLDFGIAKVLHDSLSQSEAMRATGVEPRAFTPQYGAPEQFDRRKGATGPWTDVHALALVFVELVTGRPAFEGDDVVQLMACALDSHVRPTPRAFGVDVGAEVERVLMRALAVSPEGRYSDARSFLRALAEAVGTASGDEPAPDIAHLSTAEFLESLAAGHATTSPHQQAPRSQRQDEGAGHAAPAVSADPAADMGTAEFLASLADDSTPQADSAAPSSAQGKGTRAPSTTTSPAVIAASTSPESAEHPNEVAAAKARSMRPAVGLSVAALALVGGAIRWFGPRTMAAGAGPAASAVELTEIKSLSEPAAGLERLGSDRAPASPSSAPELPTKAVVSGDEGSAKAPQRSASGTTASSATSRQAPGISAAPAPTEASDELDPAICGSSCKVDGLCSPSVVGGAVRCRAGSDADCGRSYMCTVHGACHAKKGICVALSQADCDASRGCKETGECRFSEGKCLQNRFDSDADCRRTPGCTQSGRCTAQNNGCIATREEECRASASCVKHGFCRLVGTSCTK